MNTEIVIQRILQAGADVYAETVLNGTTGQFAHTPIMADYEVKAIEAGDNKRAFVFRITSDALDRANNRVSMDGLDTSKYLRNPIVLYNHDYYTRPPVGRCLHLERVGNAMYATTEIETVTEFGRELYALIDAGFLKATSIGFIALEYEERPPLPDEKPYPIRDAFGKSSAPTIGVFTKSELVEYSICTIPKNPDAVGNSAGSLTDADMLQIAVERGVVSATGEYVQAALMAERRRKLLAERARHEQQLMMERHVETVLRAGRVLSSANVQRLKSARQMGSQVVALIDELIALVDSENEEAPSAPKPSQSQRQRLSEYLKNGFM